MSPRKPTGRASTAHGVQTRDRILAATAELLRRRGYNGAGLKEIVAASEAPLGSLYHFFPGGKQELGAEAIRESGKVYLSLIAAFFDGADDLARATKDFFDGAAEVLRQTDYEDACPIATVALEVAGTSELLRVATADVFESWLDDLERRLVAAGVARAKARELAVRAFVAIEGAFILCRATKTTEALEVAGREIADAVREAVGSGGR